MGKIRGKDKEAASLESPRDVRRIQIGIKAIKT